MATAEAVTHSPPQRNTSFTMLLQLEGMVRAARTRQELQFFFVNETRRLVPYQQAILLIPPAPSSPRYEVQAASARRSTANSTPISQPMMSINAVKGVEIGAGMKAAELTGEENADEIRKRRKKPHFLSNHAGGILGGISTGQDVVVRFAVKPTSSILTPRRTITRDGEGTDIVTKGRHDPCVGVRAVPVGVAMTACVLADHALRHRAQCG